MCRSPRGQAERTQLGEGDAAARPGTTPCPGRLGATAASTRSGDGKLKSQLQTQGKAHTELQAPLGDGGSKQQEDAEGRTQSGQNLHSGPRVGVQHNSSPAQARWCPNSRAQHQVGLLGPGPTAGTAPVPGRPSGISVGFLLAKPVRAHGVRLAGVLLSSFPPWGATPPRGCVRPTPHRATDAPAWGTQCHRSEATLAFLCGPVWFLSSRFLLLLPCSPDAIFFFFSSHFCGEHQLWGPRSPPL